MKRIAPAIILARPQLGENIGKTARAMLNFGLEDLRLVAPRDGWPNPSAGPAASGADLVLDRARVYERVSDAIADLSLVYASTVRPRDMAKAVRTPEEAIRDADAANAPWGILFGAERSGLENDEVALADQILTIPVNPVFSSLNLAQAVIVCAYEWHRHRPMAVPAEVPRVPAPKADWQGLFDSLEADLAARGYFRTAERKPSQIRALRTLFLNGGFTAQEIQTLRGVLKTLTWPVRDE